eukprot:4135942-Prymnesium_polylepis.1
MGRPKSAPTTLTGRPRGARLRLPRFVLRMLRGGAYLDRLAWRPFWRRGATSGHTSISCASSFDDVAPDLMEAGLAVPRNVFRRAANANA